MLFHFCGAYQRLAYLTLRAGKNRYQIMPKNHYLCHIALKIRRDASRAEWVQNPLGTSVQCQEDYVGRPSRVSRRVDPRRIHTNVIHRSLILVCRSMKMADKDERGMDAYPR